MGLLPVLLDDFTLQVHIYIVGVTYMEEEGIYLYKTYNVDLTGCHIRGVTSRTLDTLDDDTRSLIDGGYTLACLLQLILKEEEIPIHGKCLGKSCVKLHGYYRFKLPFEKGIPIGTTIRKLRGLAICTMNTFTGELKVFCFKGADNEKEYRLRLDNFKQNITNRMVNGIPIWEKTIKGETLFDEFNLNVVRTPDLTYCWLWIGKLNDSGYGIIRSGLAHRYSYLQRGDIPEGYQIDHLCGLRCCVNPYHLEAVPQEENLKRVGKAKTNGSYLLEAKIPGFNKEASYLFCRAFGRAHRKTKLPSQFGDSRFVPPF